MKSANWKDIAELIGIAAIVASLVFVGMQMRQDQEIAIVESRGDVTATMAELADSLKGSGHIWKKGLDGDSLTDAEQIEFLAMVQVIDSQMFTQWIRWSRLGPVPPDVAAQRYAYAIYSHPGLRLARERNREYSRKRGAAFGGSGESSFLQLVDQYLIQLDSDKPPIGDQKNYVFW